MSWAKSESYLSVYAYQKESCHFSSGMYFQIFLELMYFRIYLELMYLQIYLWYLELRRDLIVNK